MSNHTIICAACRSEVTAPSKPKPSDYCSCPKCGVGDTYENVLADVKAYVTEQAARSLQKSLKKVASSSKSMTYKAGRITTANYRFIVADLHL